MDYSTLTHLHLESWEGSGKWFADEELDIAPSDGNFEITVSLTSVPGGGTDKDVQRMRSSKVFRDMLTYQVEHQQEIFQKIMESAQKEYDRVVADKDSYDPETIALYLPEVHNQDDLKSLIAPLALHIGYTDENSIEYVGYEFDCSWDEEHGFGVRMNQSEVEDFGHADVTF